MTVTQNVWLSEISRNGWQLLRLKQVATLNYGDALSEETRTDGSVPVFGSNGIVGFHNRAITSAPCIVIGRKGSYGKVNYSPVPCFPIDTTYWIDPSAAKCDLRWLFYILPFLELDRNTLDSAVPGLSREFAYQKRLPVPPIREQRRIAAYLDEQTAKIDRLIGLRQRQIELLREQRAALIQQAVTRGLNPNAPMRDSGISWLGEIPAHWELKPLKRIAHILRGRFGHRPRTDPDLYDGPYPFIQTGDVATAPKYLVTFTQTLNEKGYSVSVEFPAGTLLMAIAANIGDLAILGFNACLPDSIVGFFPYIDVNIEFLYYNLSCLKNWLQTLAPVNTQMNLNINRLSSQKIAIPALDEQHEICWYINNIEKKIEKSINAYIRQITLLQEYRASLIHECVTGQRTILASCAP